MLLFGLEKIGLRYGWKLRDEEGIIVRHNGIRTEGSLEEGGWWWNEGWGVSEFGVLGALENNVHFLPRAALTEPLLGSSQDFPCVSASLNTTDKVLWVGSVLRSRSPCPELHYCCCVVSFSFLWQNTREHYLKGRSLLSLRTSEVLVYGCFGPMVYWPSESISPRAWLPPTSAPRSHLLKIPLPPINST